MKIIKFLVVVVVCLFGASKAMACAMCLDIYPEIIVLEFNASKAIKEQNKDYFSKHQALEISSLECTKQNLGTTKKIGDTKCIITTNHKQGFAMKLSGDMAVGLYSRIENLTVEADSFHAETDKRTGKRFKPAYVKQGFEESSVAITPIRRGRVSCYMFNKQNRCEIEINELSGYVQSK